MCETCNKAFVNTIMKIADEYVGIEKIKFNSTNGKERIEEIKKFMATDKFKEYAAKRIP